MQRPFRTSSLRPRYPVSTPPGIWKCSEWRACTHERTAVSSTGNDTLSSHLGCRIGWMRASWTSSTQPDTKGWALIARIHFEDDEDQFEEFEKDEQPSGAFAPSVPQSILQSRLRTRAILLLSPTYYQAALYPVQGSLALAFASLVAISILHSTRTRTGTHMIDTLPAYASQWVSTTGQDRIELQDHFGRRIEWEHGDVLASRRGGRDLYLLRSCEGASDDEGIYMQLVAVIDERSMKGFGLDTAGCISDECVLNIC